MTLRAPKGTDDVVPPESRQWRRAPRIWEAVSHREIIGAEEVAAWAKRR